ncbi:hypothetical protein WFJ45_24220, partial [Salmonella enterica subsp. enterica serovar Minnesota]|uniref:hypothetical protein n=1 Tax=Salmonella enterica TaxID=28901 RepID=UPI003D2C389B
RPEIVSLAWLTADQCLKARHASPNHPADLPRLPDAAASAPAFVGPPEPRGPELDGGEPGWAFAAARDLRQPVYSRPYEGAAGLALFQIQ